MPFKTEIFKQKHFHYLPKQKKATIKIAAFDIEIELFETVFLFEFVNLTALFNHQAFAAGIIWMAFRANFDFDFTFGGTCGEFVAASTSNFHFLIFWMDTLFHILFTSFFE